ncbi:TIR domain-containing protein [Photobacterium frigidiphilum]|uniref:TIR domain-containing protein n=1 Tax=Photobacterium frigidiphilum TaxID=264736 RepID=UPI003D150042
MNVFVSYTTRDSHINSDSLSSIVEPISKLGRPFIDLLHNDSIDKQKRVEDELDNSNLFVLLESESIQSSKWVRWEVNKANSLGIPIKAIKIVNDIPLLNQVVAAFPG